MGAENAPSSLRCLGARSRRCRVATRHLPARRCQRVAFSIFLRIRLRRFLISDPMARRRLAVARASRHVGPRVHVADRLTSRPQCSSKTVQFEDGAGRRRCRSKTVQVEDGPSRAASYVRWWGCVGRTRTGTGTGTGLGRGRKMRRASTAPAAARAARRAMRSRRASWCVRSRCSRASSPISVTSSSVRASCSRHRPDTEFNVFDDCDIPRIAACTSAALRRASFLVIVVHRPL